MTRVRHLLPFLVAFALGLGAAFGLAACGGTSKALIPAANADGLKADLDRVSAAVDAQDCGRATLALAQLQRDLEQLPSTTSKRLERKLQEGYDRLRRQAAKECQPKTTTTETIPTTTITTTTTPPVTTPTTTTPTTTTPTTTSTPTTPATTPTTSPDTGGVTTP